MMAGQRLIILTVNKSKFHYHILVDNIAKILPCDKTFKE